MHRAETLAAQVVSGGRNIYSCLDYKVDRVLTSRLGGYALMLLLLAVVFWLTLYGANYPSALLSNGLFWVQEQLEVLLAWLGAPLWLQDMLTQGVWRTVSWVVAVMLPPMAIFFPLFTLLEDVGYLPRVAYNLDRPFRACRSCGKQALTMMMEYIILYHKRQTTLTDFPLTRIRSIREESSRRFWSKSPSWKPSL